MQPEAGAHLWDAAEAARLVHEIVWRAATTSIPVLLAALDELVEEARLADEL
jgi:hypothetical protein